MSRSLITVPASALVLACAAQFGPQHCAFTSEVAYPYRVAAGDVDTDGDNDGLVVLWGDLYWFANDGAGTFGSRQLLAEVSLNITSNLEVLDSDMDGINDVLAGSAPYPGLGGCFRRICSTRGCFRLR